PVQLILAYQNNALHTYLRISLPKNWQLQQTFPELSHHFDIATDQGYLIFSTMPYTDSTLDLEIEPGFSFAATLDFSQLTLPPQFNLVTTFLQKHVSRASVSGIIKKNIAESSFKIDLPPEAFAVSSIPLTQLINLTSLQLPKKLATALENSSFQLPHITMDLGEKKSLSLQGSCTLFNTTLHASLLLSKDAQNELHKKIIFSLPQSINLSSLAPSLAKEFKFTLHNQKLILSTEEYEDEETNIKIRKGLNLIGSTSIEALPETPKTKPLIHALEKLIKTVQVQVVFSSNPEESLIQINIPREEEHASIPLSSFVHIGNSPLSKDAKDLLAKLSIEKPSLDVELSLIKQKVALSGGIEIDKRPVKITISIENTHMLTNKISATIDLPTHWKFSDTFKSLKKMDQLSISDTLLIYSNFYYNDNVRNIIIVDGLTLFSKVNLAGPLHPIQTFVNKCLKKFITIDHLQELDLYGAIANKTEETAFNIMLPVQISFDFEEMHKKGIFPFKKTLLKKISTKSLFVGINGKLEISVGGTILLFIDTQKNPISVYSGIEVGAEEANFDLSITGPINPFIAHWITLENIAFEIDIDYKILAIAVSTTGIPLPSGIGISGDMLLGSGDNATKIKLVSKLQLKTTTEDAESSVLKATTDLDPSPIDKVEKAALSFGSLILLGEVDHLNIMHLVDLFYALAQKKNDSTLKNLPPLELERVEIRVIPTDTELAQQYYRAGTEIDADINLLGAKGSIFIKANKYGITGKGSLQPIDTPVIKLTGTDKNPDPNLPEKGASVEFNLNLTEQNLIISGKLEIPYIHLNESTDITITPLGAFAHFEGNFFDLFKAKLYFKFNPLNPKKFDIDFTLEDDHLAFLNSKIKTAFAEVRTELENKIDTVSHRINSIHDSLTKLQQNLTEKENQKKRYAENKISSLEQDIENKKRECEHAPWYKQTYLCPKDIAEEQALKIEIDALKAYKFGIAATEDIVKITQAATKLTNLKNDIKEFLNGTEKALSFVTNMSSGIAVLTKISGNLSADDIEKEKLPAVSIEAELLGKKIKLENVQFDFKNPKDSLKNVVRQLIKSIVKKKK
ncbi:MAG: hypothetical protein WBQ73_00560, partial [Candidatus Babeliales bacterium]